MNIILVDTVENHVNFLPLTFTRPLGDLRCGVLTIKEKWECLKADKVSFLAPEYLQKVFEPCFSNINIVVDSSIIPDKDFFNAVCSLREGEAIVKDDNFLAAVVDDQDAREVFTYGVNLIKKAYNGHVTRLQHVWDLFVLNGQEIEKDFKLITSGRKSQALSKTNRLLEKDKIFVEEGVNAEFSIINPAGGYVYLGKDSVLMENSVIHGSLALCQHSTIKMSAKIYGPVTIGPHSKVGGEVAESVIQGYSNKGHDGYLGNSVLGYWCNLGADTNNSNLKNNYAEVKLWSYDTHRFVKTGLQFCGLIMGDHSKSSINTMFNTGTIVGVSANIFGSGFPRNFVPSFSWGGSAGYETYPFNKAVETAQLVMKRRNMQLTQPELDVLKHIFEATAGFRQNF